MPWVSNYGDRAESGKLNLSIITFIFSVLPNSKGDQSECNKISIYLRQSKSAQS